MLLKENIFIAICAVFFFYSGYVLFNKDYPSFPESSLIFWSTLLIYQVNTKLKFNILDLKSYNALNLADGKKLKFIFILSGILLIHVPFLNLKEVLFLIHLGLISTLYNVPEKSRGIILVPLRSIPVLKVFLIAYVWAAMASFLPPILADQQLFTSQTIYLFIAHFLFIMAITLPFDIRDFSADNKNHLITFPQLIGLIPTKVFALACLVGFTFLMHGFVKGWYFPLFSLITAMFILNASTKKQDYYFTFYLDGTIILYFIALTLSRT